MPEGEQGRNESERWFERYLRENGYAYDYEPDLDVPTHPDFRARRSDVEVVCEVKGFEEPPPLERRLAGANQTVAVSADEEYGPMRSAVREAARQLKPLAGSPWPLVVVLANPMGFRVNLSIERLVEAMYGNPGIVGNFNPEKGEVEDFHFELGRDGRLRNDHPYISAVAILHERELAREHYDEWRADWKKTREPLDHPTMKEIIAEAMAEQRAWRRSDASKNVPDGNVYWLELLTTGSLDAVPLPEAAFDGSRDQRTSVVRVPQ
jgi:heat shock protein HspQ